MKSEKISKGLLKNTTFKSSIKSFFRQNKDKIIDIILFGSSVRNKERPNDIDLLIIHKTKKDIDLSYELKKNLKKIDLEAEITDQTYDSLLSGNFKAIEGVLSDGFSLVYDKFISEGIGYMNLYLFKYELKGMNKSERMRFYYSLYGRGKEQGILRELNAIKFAETILLCPAESSEQMKNYLESWKIKHTRIPILIPNRLKNVL